MLMRKTIEMTVETVAMQEMNDRRALPLRMRGRIFVPQTSLITMNRDTPQTVRRRCLAKTFRIVLTTSTVNMMDDEGFVYLCRETDVHTVPMKVIDAFCALTRLTRT